MPVYHTLVYMSGYIYDTLYSLFKWKKIIYHFRQLQVYCAEYTCDVASPISPSCKCNSVFPDDCGI